MEQAFTDIFGVQNHLSTLQEAARAILIFSYGLVLLRISGPRMFGHWASLDIVVTIMIGSALARAMTGSAPLVGTMSAAAVMAFLHVTLAHWVARNQKLARIVEGVSVTLVDHGVVDLPACLKCKISQAHLREHLRQEGVDGEAPLSNVKSVTLEPSGPLSVVKIDPCRIDNS